MQIHNETSFSVQAEDGDLMLLVAVQVPQGILCTGVLIDAYRRPQPLVVQGQALAPVVAAMMDVSDGLLIDAERMAKASRVGIEIDLDRVPLSSAFVSVRGDGETARLFAATAISSKCRWKASR